MKKYVVLFNLETNMYLKTTYPFRTTKIWDEACTFDTEEIALEVLSMSYRLAIENKLNNWCTRTFYEL